jgi:hypothetical protein
MFRDLVADLVAARIPLERVDSHAIAMVVRSLFSIAAADEIASGAGGAATVEQRLIALRLQGSFSKDLQAWLTQICANPGARARIGLKVSASKKAGPLAAILAARQGRRGS